MTLVIYGCFDDIATPTFKNVKKCQLLTANFMYVHNLIYKDERITYEQQKNKGD